MQITFILLHSRTFQQSFSPQETCSRGCEMETEFRVCSQECDNTMRSQTLATNKAGLIETVWMFKVSAALSGLKLCKVHQKNIDEVCLEAALCRLAQHKDS